MTVTASRVSFKKLLTLTQSFYYLRTRSRFQSWWRDWFVQKTYTSSQTRFFNGFHVFNCYVQSMPRDLSRHPVYQTTFNLRDHHQTAASTNKPLKVFKEFCDAVIHSSSNIDIALHVNISHDNVRSS